MSLFRPVAAVVAALLAVAPAVAQPAVFVSDFYNNRILRVDTTTGAQVPPPVVGAHALPSSMTIGPDGRLYVTNQGSGSITIFDPVTGLQSGTISLAGQVQVPSGIAFAPNGDFFVADFVSQVTPATGTVKRFTPAGGFIATVASGLNQPSGLLVSGNNVYITETNTATFTGGRLSVFNGATTTPLVTGTQGTGYAGVARAGNILYYADLLGGAIKRFDVGTNTPLSDLVAPGGVLNNDFPSGLMVEGTGNLLVATLGANNPPQPALGELLRFSPAGAQLGGPLVTGIFGSSVVPVPEPASLLLAGGAAAAFAGRRWRRRK